MKQTERNYGILPHQPIRKYSAAMATKTYKHESNRHSRIRQNSTSKQIATGEKIEGPEIKSSNIMK